jgi:pimeloyl-ACP methyl ester carboxylesterase
MPVYHTEAGTVEMLEWGEGPDLLVLLHAAAAGPQSLSALATLLQRPGRRVVAPALNRYGATVVRDGKDRVRAHLAVLRACIDAYPAERRQLFGHSMGGLIGLLGVLQGIDFDAIALYEPIVTACLRDDIAEEAALLSWDRTIVAQADISAFVTAWNGTPWESLSASARARLTEAAPALIADMRAVSYHPLPINRLREVQSPVLLLQGAQSPAITHAMTARLAALLPRARSVTVGRCGHLGPILMPTELAGLLTSIAAS